MKDLRTGKVAITSQNHGFAVDADSLPKEMEVTHINLNDDTVEGMRHASCRSSVCNIIRKPRPARTMRSISSAVRRTDRNGSLALKAFG